MDEYVTVEGDRLDRICYRHYGHLTGCVEAVLAANYGLAGAPIVLPAGLRVRFPPVVAPRVATIRLW